MSSLVEYFFRIDALNFESSRSIESSASITAVTKWLFYNTKWRFYTTSILQKYSNSRWQDHPIEIGTLNETDIEWNITIADSIYCPSDRIFPKLLGTLNGRDIEWNITIADSIYCPSEQIFPKSFHYLLHTLFSIKISFITSDC